MAAILTMPEVATGSTEALLSSWNVAVNAPYSAGDTIVTVETDKAIVDVEAEADGMLLHVIVAEGTNVEVGAPIAVWGTPAETPADAEALLKTLAAQPQSSLEDDRAEAAGGSTDRSTASPAVSADQEKPTTRLFISPLARRLASEAGLDPTEIRGTGPAGRIRRRDVDAALATRRQPVPANEAAAPAEPRSAAGDTGTIGSTSDTGYTDVPNSRLRLAVARRLTESKQSAPHFYVRGSARVDRFLELRRELNAGLPKEQQVSVNDLIVKAVARSHSLVPALNVQWNGETTRHFDHVDVSIAVATEHGLITPVVRGVDTLSVTDLAVRVRDLADRARSRSLRQEEIEGGSISVSNLGMYGTEEFSAIINPPQASILAVGAARPEAIVVDGEVKVGQVLRATLAVDHRPVDGADAAQWMRAFVELLESPLRILA